MGDQIDCPYCGAYAVHPPSKTREGWFWCLPRTAKLKKLEAKLDHFERFKLFLETMGGIDVNYAWDETAALDTNANT